MDRILSLKVEPGQSPVCVVILHEGVWIRVDCWNVVGASKGVVV